MKKLLISCLIMCLGLANVSLAQDEVPKPLLVEKVEGNEAKYIVGYEKWKLPNGLTVILHEDHSDPIVHVEVTYHVGSARESVGKSGFAHFFEHMMFQGSDNVADEEHFAIVNTAGGTMNGTTNRDRTNYFETLPSNYLETALWLESDRMGFLLDAVTKEAFEVQRKTVKNEKGQNQLSQPYGTVGEVKDQNLYPAGHPYSWPTIGYTDDLDRADENDLKNFFLRWYGPNNAILTIAGDIDPKEALSLTEKYFGKIEQCPIVKKQRVARPVVSSDKYSVIEDDIVLPMTYMVFPSIPNYHRDEPALDMLAGIMGGDNNSLMYKNFVKAEKAIQANVFNPCFELAGEFTILVVAYPDQSLKDTEALIRSTIDQFEKEVLLAEDVDEYLLRAKEVMKSQLIDAMESVSGKASQLTQWQMLMGRPYNFDKELARYDAVTKEDLVRVFNKYIKGKSAVITNVIRGEIKPGEEFVKKSFNPNANVKLEDDPQYANLTYKKAKDDFDRSKRPVPGPSVSAVVPKYYKQDMDNGIKLIGTKMENSPKVTLLFNIQGGHLMESDDKYPIGTANLTAAMMNEGTEKWTTEEVSAELSKLGSVINFSSNNTGTRVFVRSHKDRLDQTIAVLEEKLLKPRFSEEDYKRVKKQMLENIKNQRTQSGVVANRAFQNLLYGNTILGSYYTGTYKTVNSIKLEDVQKFYKDNYSPDLTNLVVVGDIEKDEIVGKLGFLNSWKSTGAKIPEITEFPKYQGTQMFLIDRPGAPQSQIRIGYLAHEYDYNGDFFKANLMNYSLGGNFNSRINQNLREDKGFTYGARSFFQGNEYRGPFVAAASVRTSSTDSAITEFMKEIEMYKKDGITPEELADTKSSILQSEILSYETSFQKGVFMNNILRYKLPDSFIDEQEALVNKITKEEVDQLAMANLKTDEMIILVVGNSYVVKKKMEKLGYGKVKELDVNDINLKEFKQQ